MISIVLATYNGEKYLREQLESIYNQTYQNFELIVSDDCSTDSTIDILNEYRKKYGLKYIQNNKNLGFVKNFEKAIEHSTGDFIALCDQDDVWKANKLEYLLNKIGTSDLIFSDAELIDKNGRIFFNSFKEYISVNHHKENQFARLLYGNYIYGALCLFKSTLKKKILPFPEGLPYHDIWIILFAAKWNRVKFENTALMQYRLHRNNHTGIKKNSSFKDKLEYHCQTEDTVFKKKHLVYIKIIRLAKLKFIEEKNIKELEKAEKYHQIILNKNRSIAFKLYKIFFLLKFALKNKYIFNPNLSYFRYLYISLEHFFVSNSVTKYIYKMCSFFREKHRKY